MDKKELKVGDPLFRYDGLVGDTLSAGFEAEIILQEFEILRFTYSGVWIQRWRGGEGKEYEKFVLLRARKRFAYETKELALESFIAKKKKQRKILDRQTFETIALLKEAEKIKIGTE